MRTYKPRRATKYWPFGAPEYVLDLPENVRQHIVWRVES